MPRSDVDSGALEVSREPMTVVKLRASAWAWMVNPRREEPSRQPIKAHAIHVASPSKPALRETEVQGLEAQAGFKLHLGYVKLLHVPQSHSAHHAHTSVVEAL